MKIVEQHIFEVGDLFEGTGDPDDGGYVTHSRILMTKHRFALITDIGINSIEISGDGGTGDTYHDELTSHLKVGNIVYIGNALKNSK